MIGADLGADLGRFYAFRKEKLILILKLTYNRLVFYANHILFYFC